MSSFSMNKAEQHHAMLREAYELGERFPDINDDDVFEHIKTVTGKTINPESLIGHAIIIAFMGDIDAAWHHIDSFR